MSGIALSRTLRDLGPCLLQWPPETCRNWQGRPATDHMCFTWRGWPHLCRCMRCGETRNARVV